MDVEQPVLEKHKRLWREGITRDRPAMKATGIEQALTELLSFYDEKFGDDAAAVFAKTVRINLHG